MAKQKTRKAPALETVNTGAAAIDIGSREHMAAVNPDVTDMPVRAFGTFTHNLHDLAAWFKSHGVTSVAMESTGVYWVPAYEILEQHGFEVILVNARYAKNVPGRKTDVSDASWLRQLHSYGLLRGSFRPTAQIATLRAYLRQRERLVEYAAAHIQRMQKSLMEMNLQLHHVVSDITGVTGMRIIRALVGGERDLDILASYRDVRCHASVETIKAALNGPSISLPLRSLWTYTTSISPRCLNVIATLKPCWMFWPQNRSMTPANCPKLGPRQSKLARRRSMSALHSLVFLGST